MMNIFKTAATAIFQSGTTYDDLVTYAAIVEAAAKGNVTIKSNQQGSKFLCVNNEHYIRLVVLPEKMWPSDKSIK